MVKVAILLYLYLYVYVYVQVYDDLYHTSRQRVDMATFTMSQSCRDDLYHTIFVKHLSVGNYIPEPD